MYRIEEPSPLQVEQTYMIDLKSYVVCWSYDDWMSGVFTSGLYFRVATFYGKAIAALVGGVYAHPDPQKPQRTIIAKLLTDKAHRRRGAASMLLWDFAGYTRSMNLEAMQITVPESQCVPGHSTLGFLQAREFKADPKAILRGFFTALGHTEDGFTFVRDAR